MSPWFIAAIIVVAVLCLCASLYRLRRGGPGPSPRYWTPRSKREQVNENYERHGWQKPYDANGDYDKHRKLF